jgi:hypothetical protein
MPYSEDSLDGKFPTVEQKAKREKEFKTWFGYFEQMLSNTNPDKAKTIRWEPNPATFINNLYWEVLFDNVKPRLIAKPGGTRADRHKIVSLIEILISWHQPIILSDEQQRRKINAELGYFCALNIIGDWKRHNFTKLHISESFSREHLVLLESLPDGSERLPIFSNAATWYLAELILFPPQSTTP